MDKNRATAIVEGTFDKTFDKQTFILFIQNLLNDIDILDNDDNATEAFQDHVSRYTHIANYYTPDGETVDILTVEVCDDNKLDKARTSLRNFVVDYLKNINHNYALVAYYSKSDKGSKWRFSFIKIEHLTSVEGGKIKHQNEYTPAKRYSFVVGEDRYNRTAKERFLPILANDYDNPTIKQIENIFSVETLTKQFYDELFDWYLWALSDNNGFKIIYPNNYNNEEHIIRLITRIMFIWFLKQKKNNDKSLIPEDIFDIDKLSEILVDFSPKNKQSSNYYNAILQNLFFATLNRPINERDFAAHSSTAENDGQEHFSIKTFFRDDNVETYFKKSKEDILELFKQVPFLNGGLFECLDKIEKSVLKYYDGFSRDNKNKEGKLIRTFIPNHLFFTEKESVLLENYEYKNDKWHDKQRDVSGLITILKRYNFTIEENTPFEMEVALDPELLGKVFENLLGAFNDETKESARKQSGSFYTPREIVDYMVNESLKRYCLNCEEFDINNFANYESFIDNLFSNHSNLEILFNHNSDKFTEIIIQKLLNIKILDPACGSGAFPMGILNKIITILKKVDSNLNIHETKLKLIEDCIYGVDIQPIAVQISKLRFFISLICEQTPNNNLDDNYGIIPLPNLESKFIAADALIELDKEQKDKLNLEDAVLQKMKDELWNIRNHKNLRASSWQEKKKLRNEDKQLCKKIEDYLLKNSVKPDMEKILTNKQLIEQYEEQITELPEDWIEDFIIQGSLFGEEKPRTLFQKDRNKEKRDDILKRIYFCKTIIAKEERKATLTGLEAIIHKMISWDPYDQNATSSFFDPEWMFGLTPIIVENDLQSSQSLGVFDIVIGNPPYIEAKKLKHIAPSLKNFSVYSGTADYSVYFTEHGLRLCKERGLLMLITTNKFFFTGYGKLVREFLLKHQISSIIDFEQVEVFDNVLVSSVVLGVKKTDEQAENFTYQKFYKLKKEEFKRQFVEQQTEFGKYEQKLMTESEWSFSDNTQLALKEKIENAGIKICDLEGVAVFRGVTTGYNPAFVINNYKKNELIAADPNNLQIIKPLLQGRNIRKWVYNESNDFLLQTGFDIDIEKKHPIIFDYLCQFMEELEVRADQGKNWFNLRACKYYPEFEKSEKIIWGLTADKWAFAYDDKQHYLPSNGYILTSENIPVKYLLALLNSNVLKYYFGFIGVMTAGGAYTLKHATIQQLPIVIAENQQLFIILIDYILFLKQTQNDSIIPIYYENIIDACIYELYFPEEVHAAQKGVIKHLQDLKSISDVMDDEQKLSIINSEFVKFYDPYHPVRNNVETIENIETIRIIKSSVQ